MVVGFVVELSGFEVVVVVVLSVVVVVLVLGLGGVVAVGASVLPG